MSSLLDALNATSHLSASNADFVEQLYEDYLTDPASITGQWRQWFDQIQAPGGTDIAHRPVLERFRQLGKLQGKAAAAASKGSFSNIQAKKQAEVLRLINAYRVRGHQKADLDPLQLSHRPETPDLELAFHGLNNGDLDTSFNVAGLATDQEMTLRDLMSLLEKIYCNSIGVEYMHIADTPQRRWLQRRLEGAAGQFNFNDERKKAILEQLTHSEGLEKYLHTKYVGQKRFSLEGAESLIPLIHGLIQRVGGQGVKEVVMGMAHRGRLNALVNLLGKSPRGLFDEFEGKASLDDHPYYSGDVKYHMGFSSEMDTPGGVVHVAMGFNPSHLEIIDPVVVGSARARQTRRGDKDREQVMPVLIHGDAAFAGQGVVMELFNMSQARGFQVGGTLHVIINNQIGFTTDNPVDTRSTLYCTEVAKMVQAPIFHVNADDPEAVVFCMEVASDFRMAFKKDVVIDMVCYRRHGHNEADEPAATQPVMYRKIRAMKTTRELYAQRLIDQGIVDQAGVKRMVDDYRDALDEGHPVAEIHEGPFKNTYNVDWHPYLRGDWKEVVDTTIPAKRAEALAASLQLLPDGFELHPRVQRIMDDRKKMAAGKISMDWGYAEMLAYASLLEDGYGLRLVGQDSGRGTFFHRHAVLHNQVDGSTHIPLFGLRKEQTDPDEPRQAATIIDSLLSEEAVLGFEYGFASADPQTLLIWEGQFGDFVNGAQVVIDQFISSGEAKWRRLCGLVMFLPHGYEGQGPEHSSARLERFMQLSAQFNIQICIPTTPAQMFHLLRRQMLRHSRKPLIVLTPKSLLRNKASTSELRQISNGRFRVIIRDHQIADDSKVERIVVCSGKVYYDLAVERDKRGLEQVSIMRIEQVYPFPRDEFIEQIERFSKAKQVVWCQEEPVNQGAWHQIRHHLQACLGPQHELIYAARQASPSPAVGVFQKHVEQQAALVDQALTLEGSTTSK